MMNLEDFVRESNRIEGIERAAALAHEAEQFAREVEITQTFITLTRPTVLDLENFVFVCTEMCAHPAVLRRRVGMDVRVGTYAPPPGGHMIEVRLAALLEDMGAVDAYQTHLAYEHLHPFTDGNGRSGRALWLWQIGGHAPLGFLHSFYYQTFYQTFAAMEDN